MKPVEAANHNTRYKSFIQKDLRTSTHVFLRNDAVSPPLIPPYNGPYEVLERKTNTFIIQVRNKKQEVAIDRLKAAFIENEELNLMQDKKENINNSDQNKKEKKINKQIKGNNNVKIDTKNVNKSGSSSSKKDEKLNTKKVKKSVSFKEPLPVHISSKGRVIKAPQRFSS